mmetsp:Transcript_52604/g.59739  ORF Transcript_52604/g.59739 Transcript_52604/m.59739 type:complete len:202 (+) Transcript_52604:397-1002(+)
MLLLNSIAKKLSIWNWRNKIVSSLITVCRTVTAMLLTVAIAMAVATATPFAIPTTTTTITVIALPLLIPDMPPTPPLVTIAIPLTVVPAPPATVEVVTVRVVAITVARVVKEEDITVAKVAKEATVEEETQAAPFTTVGAVPPPSTPPIRTGVTMAVAEITATRTAMVVAMEEAVIIMGTARRTTITGVATLFDSFLSSRG